MPLDSSMQQVLDAYAAFAAPPLETLSPENARNLPTLRNAVEDLLSESTGKRVLALAKPNPEPVRRVSHIVIPGPGGPVLARVYTPSGTGPHPVLVYFHGGGWVIAGLDVYEPSCRALCNAAECIVVSVGYRLAPEHKFPAATIDAFAAVDWVMRNAEDIGGDPDRVAVGGESAGGNLATVTCLRLRERNARMPIAQLLIYPVTDSAMNYPSYREHAHAKPLNAAMMRWFWMHYLRSGADASDPFAAPLRANDLSDMPPAIVITAERDPLRDEGELYAARLADEGVHVVSRRFDGVAHEFFGLAGMGGAAKEALDFAAEGLRDEFERGLSAPQAGEGPTITPSPF